MVRGELDPSTSSQSNDCGTVDSSRATQSELPVHKLKLFFKLKHCTASIELYS
jgi:hypothetical protein